MKKKLFIIISLLINTYVFAITITVKQDGMGDYSTIQAAVDAAMPYDTVLVWPGTYYENVILENKSLWLASLSLTTGDPSYRNTTIIDGNQNGACVAMVTDESNTNVFLHGFTIQNGSGHTPQYADYTTGGGVFVGKDLNSGIENCIIKNNDCIAYGGGICLYFRANCYITDCKIYNNTSGQGGGGITGIKDNIISLSNTSIYQNRSFATGGGLVGGYESVVIFDSINRCSIYNNYSQRGCDIGLGGNYTPTDIYLDTLSVLVPERYFVYSSDINGFFIEDDISYDILNGWIEPVDADLYVNPISGNDQNSGLNSDNALKTIAFAFCKIAIDSLNPNTIHLADGIYSDSLNGEKFPVGLRQFVNIEGESMDSTILDGEYKTFIFKSNNELSNYKLSKMKMQRGNEVDYEDSFAHNFGLAWLYRQGENITLDSIIFKEGWSETGYSHVDVWAGNNLVVSNCQFLDNMGGSALSVGGDSIGDTCVINNCIFQGHRPDTNHPNYPGGCFALSLGGSHDAISIATNCLFVDNEDLSFAALFGSPLSFDIHHNYLVNCTFANNSSSPLMQGWSFWIDGVHNHFYNCIMYSEGPPQAFMLGDYENLGKTHLDIYNSLVQTGEDAIYADAGTTYYYDTATNIDADPIFLGMWDHPYMIADGSPCINTGTLANLPDFIVLPETDLAGNPRIVGDSIDMGCYEWNPTIVGFNEIGPGSEKEKPKLLKASPNPFGSSTRISIKYKSEETVKVEIYDSFGHRVKTMLTSNLSEGSYELKWDGTDNNGNHLPQGVYFVIMFSGEKEVESLKVVKR